MSRPWYATALPEPRDAAWEVYHENSRQEPGAAFGATEVAPWPLAFAGLPALTPETVGAPVRPALAADRLLSLLAAGGRPLHEDDPILLFVYIPAIAGLADALAVHDPSGPSLRLLAADVPHAEMAATLRTGALEGTAAIIFLAADLEAATEAGERGYREALIATGRRIAALEAAAPAGVAVRRVEVNDRAADALLSLDGLSRSVLAAVAVVVDG